MTSRGRTRRLLVDVPAVLVGAALLGLLGGLLWVTLWDPPQGVVQDGSWLFLDFPTIERIFSATGLYVVIGLLGGLLLGVVAAFCCRSPELAVLAAVTVGAALAAWLAHQVGTADSPVNPRLLALVSEEGTRLPGSLETPGRVQYVAWPMGALLGLAMTYLLSGAATAGSAATEVFDRRAPQHPTAHAAPSPSARLERPQE
ncbi:hypothetical protein [Nocardioides litoris]|uniref:hypothetical protein n=1 Tax=Nocardioides litoris TaxID=1926648 RepID=UPI00111D4BEB|nr:hypothetical protein [Nocardioides litoris]